LIGTVLRPFVASLSRRTPGRRDHHRYRKSTQQNFSNAIHTTSPFFWIVLTNLLTTTQAVQHLDPVAFADSHLTAENSGTSYSGCYVTSQS
jgi:hypothetical protein